MSVFNTVMSDTVGVLWRASSSVTGASAVDPWTQNEINDNAAKAIVQASNGSINYDDALKQAQQDTQQTVAGAPSYSDAAKTSLGSVFNDSGDGCSITNLGGCYPSWLPYAVIAVGILGTLWLLRPYVQLLEE